MFGFVVLELVCGQTQTQHSTSNEINLFVTQFKVLLLFILSLWTTNPITISKPNAPKVAIIEAFCLGGAYTQSIVSLTSYSGGGWREANYTHSNLCVCIMTFPVFPHLLFALAALRLFGNIKNRNRLVHILNRKEGHPSILHGVSTWTSGTSSYLTCKSFYV